MFFGNFIKKRLHLWMIFGILILLSGCTAPLEEEMRPERSDSEIGKDIKEEKVASDEAGKRESGKEVSAKKEASEKKALKKITEVLPLLNQKEVENNFKILTATPRKRGTKDNQKAGDFLLQKMKDYGYEASFQEFDGFRTKNAAQFFENFENRNPNNEKPIFRGRNIVCMREDFDPALPTVIYSAHYDTTTDNIGAFDNASGVCSLLETARVLQDAKLPYNIKFVFFDSEEYYLQGSRHFVYALNEEEMKNIYANFNVDMVGNKKARSLLFVGNEEGELFWQAKQIFKDKKIGFSIWGQSDDMSFEKRNIKAIRYTSVDTFSKEFEPKLWTKEEDTSWVSIKHLMEDIEIIATYAIKLKVQ